MPLDIGIGILFSLGVAEYFDVKATPFLIAFGICSILLPDIDIVTTPLNGKWYHRMVTHYPLAYLPLVGLAFIFLPSIYATLFALCIYFHLIHDTFGIGWGIAWLWPFSGRKFLLFPAKDRPEFNSLTVTWLPEEEPALVEDGHRWDWVRHYYFRSNTLAYIEYGGLLVGLLSLVLYFA